MISKKHAAFGVRMKPPVAPPLVEEILGPDQGGQVDLVRRVLNAAIRTTVDGKYRHWDTLRQLTPPPGLTHEEWWLGLKIARSSASQRLPLTDAGGTPFWYTVPNPAQEMLVRIDKGAPGDIGVAELVTTPDTQRRYLVSSLIEEAITSSQLEGASTTHRVAKDMIKSGRRPRDLSERMIVNNYAAMNLVREWVGEDLTPERILELHTVVTGDTLRDPASAGRVQRPGDDRIVVGGPTSDAILHVPPPAEQLPKRMESLCEWANGGGSQDFVHPVVRAIVIHLWLAYDHPFEDGNGRTARVLFYWSMLSQGYWLTEFLSVSRILLKARSKYARSFLFTETDGLDATYFLLYQLSVITRAIDDLHAYMRRKMREVRSTEALLQSSELGYRQIALLGRALRHPDSEFTAKSHAASHRVTVESARLDLQDLVGRGLLTRRRIGREMVYRPVPGLAGRIEAGQDQG